MKRISLLLRLAVIVFILLIPHSRKGCGQTGDLLHNEEQLKGKIDKIFEKWDNSNSPGAAISIVKDGEVLFKNGYGMSNLEYDIPIKTNTIFHVASVSKQFTAFAVILLEQEGKLSFDDDIRKYLPELPDFKHKISIRHLIHHTSGLRDQWDLSQLSGVNMHDEIKQEHILKLVSKQKELNFPPGERRLYCNTGYTLLAEIVAVINGQSFQEYTEQNIFEPLGMKDTHFHAKNEQIVKNRSYSYYKNRGKFWKSTLSFSNFGATSLFTTVEDLAKWILNFENPKVGGEEVIKKMLVHGKLNDGTVLDYCFGIEEFNYRGLRNISHSGSDAGYQSFLQYFPDQKIGFIVLSNLSEFKPRTITGNIAKIFLGDKFVETNLEQTPPVELKEIEIDPAILDDFLGEYSYNMGQNVKIIKRDGQLHGIVPFRNAEYALFPESDNKFFTRPFIFAVSFQRDEDGNVYQLTWHYPNGPEGVAKKINYKALTAEELRELTGVYFGEEIGTVYTIELEEDNLVAKHIRNPDSKLTQYDKDAFRGNRWLVRFVEFMRDEKSNVIGLKMSTSRVLGLKFRKIK